jgi:uncharacterized protein (DUF1800 family)
MIDTATIAAIRFGHGLPLPEGAPTDAAGLLALLAGPDRAAQMWPGVGLAEALPLFDDSEVTRKVFRQDRTNTDLRRDYFQSLKAVERQAFAAAGTGFARALGSPDGFRERLVTFWADHFTTVSKKREHRALVPAMVEDAIRPNVAGHFGALLKAATFNPAMLFYLDQTSSVGPNSPRAVRFKRGLNENLARELIELHTLGVGAGYSQKDVREMAELLTGLVVRGGEGQVFNPRAAEPGSETVLGRIYDGAGVAPILAALDDLALRPETGRHLSRKLAVHFVSDVPDPGLVTAMEVAYARTGGNLMAVYAAMLGHPAAWGADFAKARQPYDFIAAAMRALDVGPDDVLGMPPKMVQARLLDPMRAMGQPMNDAPGPDGWPEEAEAWINPQGLAARISWAMEMPARLVDPLPGPAALADRALGPLVSDRLRFAVGGAENIREGVGLVFASAEFNRR